MVCEEKKNIDLRRVTEKSGNYRRKDKSKEGLNMECISRVNVV
jgi:hypothetical protein